MNPKRTSAKTLAEYEAEHRQLARRLSDIGFLWPGTLSRRYLKCGNPRCACQRNPDARHGPYLYWTTKKDGKTLTIKFPTEEARILEPWIRNRQHTKEILQAMMDISRKAYPLALKKDAQIRDRKSRR